MGGRGSAGSTPSFTQSGSKISVNGDTINMTKRGAYQGTVGERKRHLCLKMEEPLQQSKQAFTKATLVNCMR